MLLGVERTELFLSGCCRGRHDLSLIWMRPGIERNGVSLSGCCHGEVGLSSNLDDLRRQVGLEYLPLKGYSYCPLLEGVRFRIRMRQVDYSISNLDIIRGREIWYLSDVYVVRRHVG
jgi:hypothetical protein